ncbi:unnamed protein product [Toxocara canis]|uniref:MFS domain-containing protein n=1 Tax=Toxocara canis TaxID=6265 RepID=A0A183V215_TOXCA|nr:unnamed protein product [Toxocara canis]
MSESDFDDFHLYAKAPLWSAYTQLFFDVVALCAALILFAAIALRKRNLKPPVSVYFLQRNLKPPVSVYFLQRNLKPSVSVHFLQRNLKPPVSVYFLQRNLKPPREYILQISGLNAAAMNLLAVVAERISAVMFVRVYERFGASIPLYGICLGLVQWAASVVIVSLKIQRSMSQFIVVGIWFCSHLLAAVPRVARDAKACVMMQLWHTVVWSIERFLTAIVLTSVFLARCSHLRMAIVRWLRRSNAVAPSEYPPRSLNGDNLVVPVEDEGRVYFEALAISWAWRRQ